jgi:hypothetical protein
MAGDPNSLSAQRGRLPGGMACDDPASGVWVSTKYLPATSNWYVFTLKIHRSGRALRGTVLSRFWLGSPWDSSPPQCDQGGIPPLHAVVSMAGSGSIDGPQMVFGGTSITNVQKVCPSWRSVPHYAVDTFTGTLDLERGEFQSVGNDGGRMRDVPLLFRRIACAE